jgi:hypothetical protein
LSYHAYGEVVRQYDLKEKDVEQFIVQLEDELQRVKGILSVNSAPSASRNSAVPSGQCDLSRD